MMASRWKFNEVGTYIETENEKYAEIISMVERRRTAEKYLKIQKVREEKTVGVRLTRTFFIYIRGNDFGYKKFVLVELVPPPKLYLRAKEFYATNVGTRFRLPDGHTFKFYENAVECWHLNNILSDQKQLKILLRCNFDKFVRALETIGKPTAATRQYDYNTCMSISPHSVKVTTKTANQILIQISKLSTTGIKSMTNLLTRCRHSVKVAMKRADQGLIQITKMNAVRKNNMSSLLMRSQAMKKKFTVWKKKIMILNLIQRKFLTWI